MNYNIIEQGLGVVILGTFTPQLFTIENLVNIGVIKQEEREQARMNAQNQDSAVFNVRNIRVMCDRFRLQIVTIDIVVIPRLIEFCRDVMNTMNVNAYRGVGINTHLKIGFTNEADLHLFKQRLLPPQDGWLPICENGQCEVVTIRNGNKTIELLCEEENECYSFNINNHHESRNIGEIVNVVNDAQVSFDSEIRDLNRFLSAL